MEQWEIDLRAKLEAELPDRAYDLSTPKMVFWTGKQGMINFEVEIHRAVSKMMDEFKNKEDGRE